MKIKFTHIMNGPGPSEAIVQVRTKDRFEEVVVDNSLLSGGLLDVGPILMGPSDEQYLVQLPREAVSGSVRVWIPEAEVVRSKEAA